MPLERVRLRLRVDLNCVSHVVVVEVGRARDDLVIGLGLGLGIGLELGLGIGVRMRVMTSCLCATRCTHRFALLFTSCANAALPTLGQPKLMTCTSRLGYLCARRIPNRTLSAAPSEWPVTKSLVSEIPFLCWKLSTFSTYVCSGRREKLVKG